MYIFTNFLKRLSIYFRNY